MNAGASTALLAGAGPLWQRIRRHPFVLAAADGSLDPVVFDRWLVADYGFVLGFRRFLGALVALAPDPGAADVLAAALGPLASEVDLFRREAAHRGLDLAAEPGPTALGYTSYLLSAPGDGWPVAVTVLFGAEKAYSDAWSAVRQRADPATAYWPFVDNWSSPAFAAWVDEVAALVDAAAADGPTPAMRTAFGRVVSYELRFWDAVTDGDPW